MSHQDWDAFASELTTHVRHQWRALQRGAVLMPCIDETATFALIFANNDFAAPAAVHEEVDQIRHYLRAEDMEDLDFGLSNDGYTWTLIVRIHGQVYRTDAGRILQRELLKIRLEEAVQKAWASVCAAELSVQPELVRMA